MLVFALLFEHQAILSREAGPPEQQDLYTAHFHFSRPCADPEEAPPLKNHKNIGFLSNTGLDPLKNHKATNPAFNVGPAKCHLNDVSLAGR